MPLNKQHTAIVITGPTASGKTALAVELASFLGTEIVNADSRQIYQGIPISTAMPTAEERARVPHRLIDFLPLESYYSAAQYEQDALRELCDIFGSNKEYAVVCGGSMMYVDALCHGIDDLPDIPAHVRQGLMREHALAGDEWLLSELRATDPEYYERVDRKNLKRVFHAVELSRAAGVPYSSMLSGRRTERDFRILKFGIFPEREILFERINKRVDNMVAEGLEEEARRVFDRRHLNSLNTVGLKEMFAYISGNMDFSTAVARIGKNTRVYAKKQITWYQRDADILRLSGSDTAALLHQILQTLK